MFSGGGGDGGGMFGNKGGDGGGGFSSFRGPGGWLALKVSAYHHVVSPHPSIHASHTIVARLPPHTPIHPRVPHPLTP